MPRRDRRNVLPPSSATAFSFIMDKTQKARKEGRRDGQTRSAEKCCLLVAGHGVFELGSAQGEGSPVWPKALQIEGFHM